MTEPPLPPETPMLARLDHLAVLEVSGDDRTSWLQGQVTNDVLAFVDGGTMRAFHLDAQGRILAEVEGVHAGASWLLLVDASVAAQLVRDLDRRIVMEDVTIRVLEGATVFATRGLPVSDVPALASLDSDRFGAAWTELVVPASASAQAEATLSDRARSTGGSVVEAASLDAWRTLCARPRFGIDFGPTTLPQETGLHTSRVSFVKGCYVGQEPVVMIEHRGKPPRRMVVLELADAIALPVDLTRADGTVAGRCTSLAASPAGGYRGLGIVKRADAVVGAELGAGSGHARVLALVGAQAPVA